MLNKVKPIYILSLPLLITLASPAIADSKPTFALSYSNLSQKFTYQAESIQLDVDGAILSASVPISYKLNLTASYGQGTASLAGYGFDVKDTSLGVSFDILNDLDFQLGFGKKINVAVQRTDEELSGIISGTKFSVKDHITTAGVKAEFAVSNGFSLVGTAVTDVKNSDFNYGIGFNAGLTNNGYFSFVYTSDTANIDGLQIDSKAYVAGYNFRF